MNQKMGDVSVEICLQNNRQSFSLPSATHHSGTKKKEKDEDVQTFIHIININTNTTKILAYTQFTKLTPGNR